MERDLVEARVRDDLDGYGRTAALCSCNGVLGLYGFHSVGYMFQFHQHRGYRVHAFWFENSDREQSSLPRLTCISVDFD